MMMLSQVKVQSGRQEPTRNMPPQSVLHSFAVMRGTVRRISSLTSSRRSCQRIIAHRVKIQALVSTADPSPLVAQRPGLDIPISDISTIFGAPGTMIKSDGNSGIQKANDVLRDGKTLEENKGTILYLAGPDATDSEKALLLAMAMLETDHMDESELDSSKDGDDASRNISCFNLNQDMLRRAGWNGDRHDLRNVIQCLLKWLRGQVPDQAGRPANQHVIDTLNFVRGGWTAFSSGGSFWGAGGVRSEAEIYRDAIASMYRVLRSDPTNPLYDDGQGKVPHPRQGMYLDSKNLWANNTRIWIRVVHV